MPAGICDGYTYEGIKEKWPETYAARKADKLNFRYPAGESYMDVIKRLEPTIIEMERENESVCVTGHQAILRCLYAYFMHVPREDVRLALPAWTLVPALRPPIYTLQRSSMYVAAGVTTVAVFDNMMAGVHEARCVLRPHTAGCGTSSVSTPS